ncbi:hypothetical protein C1646_772304 [Rhizophagus diaphanus]|nr:hypothetical protein C1646_772304 [Rhizophagus diaphanus] [Rhizophagus sp. MUCL 43196]
MNNRQKNKQSPYIFQYQPPSNKNQTSQRDVIASDNSLIDPIDPNMVTQFQPSSDKNKTSQRDAIASDNSLIDPIDPNTVTQFQPSSDKNKTSQRDVAASSTSLIDSKRASQSQLPSSDKSKNKTSQQDTAASSTSLIDPYRVSQSQLPSYESQRDAAASSTSDPNRPPQLEPNILTVAESLRSLRNVTEQEATTRLPTATYKELLTENNKLRRELKELRNQNSQLEKKIEEAKAPSGEMKHLQEQVEILATVNEELGNENDELRSKLKIFDKYRLSRGINYESSGDSSKQYSPESSLENISESSDKEKMDEVNARIEMKTILKGVNEENGLNYEETFNSTGNLKVRGRLIKELRENMVPKYHPSVNQLTKWLGSIHKSRRSQAKLRSTGKIEGDHRRVHCNSRLNDLKNLLRNVLDAHSLTIQSAQLQRSRYYDDEVQYFDYLHPSNAPRWAFIDQHDIIFDTTEHEKSTEEYRSEINEELEETAEEIEEVLLAGGDLTMDY